MHKGADSNLMLRLSPLLHIRKAEVWAIETRGTLAGSIGSFIVTLATTAQQMIDDSTNACMSFPIMSNNDSV
jgi:hypothetical protein